MKRKRAESKRKAGAEVNTKAEDFVILIDNDEQKCGAARSSAVEDDDVIDVDNFATTDDCADLRSQPVSNSGVDQALPPSPITSRTSGVAEQIKWTSASRTFITDSNTPVSDGKSWASETETQRATPGGSKALQLARAIREQKQESKNSVQQPDEFISLDFGQGNGGSIQPNEESTQLENLKPLQYSPWTITRYQHIGNDKTTALHEEILDFARFLSPSVTEREQREQVFSQNEEIVLSVLPNCRVEIFGSFKSGLFIPSSDIDMVLFNTNTTTKAQRVDLLYSLARRFNASGHYEEMQVIAHARVPIIKYKHSETGIPLNIAVEVNDGIRSTAFCKEMVEKYSFIHPLVTVLKQFLHSRSLNETYTGGVGSYLLVCMVLSSIQHCPAMPTPASNPSCVSSTTVDRNLGAYLLNFLEMFGRTFNYVDLGICVRGSGKFFNKSKKGWYNYERPHALCVEDPCNTENDIAGGAFNIHIVRRAFETAFFALTVPPPPNGGDSKTSLGRILGWDLSVRRPRPRKLAHDSICRNLTRQRFVGSGVGGANVTREMSPTSQNDTVVSTPNSRDVHLSKGDRRRTPSSSGSKRHREAGDGATPDSKTAKRSKVEKGVSKVNFSTVSVGKKNTPASVNKTGAKSSSKHKKPSSVNIPASYRKVEQFAPAKDDIKSPDLSQFPHSSVKQLQREMSTHESLISPRQMKKAFKQSKNKQMQRKLSKQAKQSSGIGKKPKLEGKRHKSPGKRVQVTETKNGGVYRKVKFDK